MVVRPATAGDAEAAAQVLTRSIAELCTLDHRYDAAILDGWLANKTPDHFRAWLANPLNTIVVAEAADGALAGVAGCTAMGEVILNYVAPDARFQGVSKAMLAWLEAHLRVRGVPAVTLTSTRTAEAFYRALGYGDAGLPTVGRGGMPVQQMRKPL